MNRQYRIKKRLSEKTAQIALKPIDAIKSKSWMPYSKLIIKSDGANWVLSSIAEEMKFICDQLGIKIVDRRYLNNSKEQSVYYTSKYEALLYWQKPKHRIAFPYYHGDPSTDVIFKTMFENICKYHNMIHRIQVSHSQMEKLILDTGIDERKVFRIPISIDLDLFEFRSPETKKKLRKQLDIPESAVVIGSFQKDGNGMGRGLEPKLIKGPDTFLSAIEILKGEFPNLFVLLTGPARGYVIMGLEKLKVPYRHLLLNSYSKINDCYNAIDLYLIASREEGGPRAILESMASGTPLVTTKVGQAMVLPLTALI